MTSISAAIFGLILGAFSIAIFNKIPALWLCDYGETPTEKHYSKIRIPRRLCPLFAAVLSAASFFACAGEGNFLFAFAVPVILLLLLLITLSDAVYSIIPDQLLVMLGVISALFAFLDISSSADRINAFALSPIAGFFAGGAVLLLINFLGAAVFRQNVLGFGDIKLFAAIGILTGFPGTFAVMLITLLFSGLSFAIQLALKLVTVKDTKPLGPYIAVAAAVFLCFHSEISLLASWYVSLFY